VSSSPDTTVRVWDVKAGSEISVLRGHEGVAVDVTFNYDGSRLATTCKDGALRVFDLRSGALLATMAKIHQSALDCGVCWLGNTQRIFTCGFSSGINREFAVWQFNNDEKLELLTRDSLDQVGAGIVSPVFDEDTGLIFCAGKGDASISLIEVDEEFPFAHIVAVIRSSTPQRGIAFGAKQMCDVRKVEIRRILKLTPDGVVPMKVRVPRQRMEFFQDDLFPNTRALQPACSAADWKNGKSSTPILESLKPTDMTKLSDAPPLERKPTKYKLKSLAETKEEDATEQLFKKMNRLKGIQSIEDKELQEREGVDEDEWDDDGDDDDFWGTN